MTVDLYFKYNTNDGWIHALAIPLADIMRLSYRPLKWLRFVAFAILGAEGGLYDAPGPGAVVNYDIELLNDGASYYFVPDVDGPYPLIDHQALNDRITSSASTLRRTDFHESVVQRDGNLCVISSESAPLCDAAHIIPHAKGDEYIEFVITQRRRLYEDWYPAEDISINSTENGMFVRKDIHARLATGMSAFLKTPNFALISDDIPRLETDKMLVSRVTLQHIARGGPHSAPAGDVRADWFGQSDAPPSIILDYMYGVAIVKRWHAPDIQSFLNSRHMTFASLQPKARPSTFEDDGDDDADVGDSSHSEYKEPARRKGRRRIHQSRDSELCQAMDFAFEFNMHIRGYPLGTTSYDTSESAGRS